jgi:hypothetical protein
MAPPLRIPLSISMEEFERQSQKAASVAGDMTRQIVRQFAKMNGDVLGLASSTAAGVGLAWSQSVARAALGFAAAGTVFVFTAKLIGAAISSTREQLEKMVEIADKAQTATVTPRFFQAFTAEAQKLQIPISELEGALNQAFQSTKDQAPVDLDKWSVGEDRITSVEKALRVYNETLAKAQGQTLGGLVLFRDADTQEKKVVAVLEAMRQLDEIGQHAAALDVGEKMFGAAFVDRIRQGRTSAAEMLETIRQSQASSDNMFSNETIRRAKEIDDQLKRAHQTLEQNLRPTWDGLADKILLIKGEWAQIVDLIARAAALAQKFNFLPSAAGPLANKQQELRDTESWLQDNANPGMLGTLLRAGPGTQLYQSRQSQAAKLKEQIDGLLEMQREGLKGRVPTSRGTGDAPTPTGDEDSTAAFDRAIDSANKHAAAMEADARAVGLSESAHARLRVEAALVEALLQDGVEDASQYADQIAKVGDRTEAAAQKLAEAKRSFEGMNDALRFTGNQLVDVFERATQKGANFGDIMRDVLRAVERQMLQAAITGEGAFAKMFGLSSSTGGVGGFMGIIGSLFGGARAGGGSVERGRAYRINENTPNSEWFVPGMSGQVVPDQVMSGRGRGGGNIYVSLTSAPIFHPGMTATDMAAIDTKLQVNNEVMRGQVLQDLRRNLKNDSDYLGS